MSPAAEKSAPITSSEDEDWWRSAVVYQVYPRSFQDSNGDGIGDLEGIRRRLGYLVELGVGVLWLSPFYPSPQDDNGYDISDYENVDPLFGTLDDFDRLIADAHEIGLRVILDLVVNHTSDEHPWFVESRSNRHNPKRDWYIWRQPRSESERPEPNNWESAFSGSAWQLDDATGEYYLHLFSAKQPDLNWENPEVRSAVYAMMRWWVRRGADGFRMDVVNYISKDPELPDVEVADGDDFADGGRYYITGPRAHEFLHEMHEEVLGRGPKRLLAVGEMPGVTLNHAQLFTGQARRELDMVFQFEHMELDHGSTKWQQRLLRLSELKASLARWQHGLGQEGWNSLYWNNHDQPRVVSRFGNDGPRRGESAKALAMVLHLHRGTPFIYQGEELGMTNAGFRQIHEYRDLESRNHFAHAMRRPNASADDILAVLRTTSRDNARTPMQWDATSHAGFTTGTPWISVNDNHREINAQAEVGDAASIFTFYQELIRLRHSEPVIVDGDYELLYASHEQLFCFSRSAAGVSLLVVANLSDEPAAIAPELSTAWRDAELILTNLDSDSPTLPTVARPWEAWVLRRDARSEPSQPATPAHHEGKP